MNELTTSNPYRWDPFRELVDIRDTFDKFFGRGIATQKSDNLAKWSFIPPVEIVNKKDQLQVRAELPGMDKKDIHVTVEDGTLILRGETKREEQTQDGGATYSERTYGAFYRTVGLPAAVDEKAVKAAYKDGILTVTLPKTKEEKEKVKAVEVE